MKRQHISLADITSLQNLHSAAYKTFKGRRQQPAIQQYAQRLDHLLPQLARAINQQALPFAPVKRFTIHDPKKRQIVAASVPDRIIHHAIFNLAGNTLEKASFHHSYACRPNKGVHRAVQQVQRNMQRYPVFVKLDISGYFEHIDHAILLALLAKRYKGGAFLQLLAVLVCAHHGGAKGKGLPIGWLSSQYFANYYLDGLDRYLAAQTTVKANLRYMDDILFWCANKHSAQQLLQQVREWLLQQRGLNLKPNSQIGQSSAGTAFCGFRIKPAGIYAGKRKQRRFTQHWQHWHRLYQAGLINSQQWQRASDNGLALLQSCHSKALQQRVLAKLEPSV